MAGVGTATVDRVLNERGNVSVDVADRVLSAAKGLNLRRVLPGTYRRTLRAEVLLARPELPLRAIAALQLQPPRERHHELPLRRRVEVQLARPVRRPQPEPACRERLRTLPVLALLRRHLDLLEVRPAVRARVDPRDAHARSLPRDRRAAQRGLRCSAMFFARISTARSGPGCVSR